MTIQTINADQVAYLQHALQRFSYMSHTAKDFPACSQYRYTNELSFILEIMEIFSARFQDETAQRNAFVHINTLSRTSPRPIDNAVGSQIGINAACKVAETNPQRTSSESERELKFYESSKRQEVPYDGFKQ